MMRFNVLLFAVFLMAVARPAVGQDAKAIERGKVIFGACPKPISTHWWYTCRR